MTLEPFFMLDPHAPSYESPTGGADAPRVKAFVNFWNIAALAWGGSGGTKPTLESQLNEGWVYLSGSSAAPFDEDVDGTIQNRERSPVIEIGIQGVNVNARNKILLKIDLHALGEYAVARIALDRQVLRTDHLQPGDNTVSVLIDCPYDRAWIYVDVKHVQTEDGRASAFGFKKVTGYLL